MSHYLLQISIGPVQDFIAAARRTRDLWFGSYLLSEISKAAAKSIQNSDAAFLIFPHSDNLDEDLKAGSPFNVANVILAEVSEDSEAYVKSVAREAENSAEARWMEFVNEAFNILENGINKDKWEDQKKTKIIEFYSAWYPFKDESDYKQARQEVVRLLSARKNLRDFEPWKGDGVPKSSLDGRRESVLKKHGGLNIKGVRIKKGEALDLVGCVKRAAGAEKNTIFPSVVSIALDPWIRGIKKKGDKALKELYGYCEDLISYNALSRHKSADARFPYDATVLLPSRYIEFKEESSNPEMVRGITEKMKRVVQELHSFHKPMEPYLAVLVADGDRIGKAISEVKSLKEHKDFSETLSCFALNAREIVEKNFGCCVYTGGDDVLAFLPMDKAISCARELHDEFGSLWKIKEDWSFKDSLPTLSVGISIAHAFEDLEDLLEFGREAEKLAKKASAEKDSDRNGLAVTIRARGNSRLFIREQWKVFFDSNENHLSNLSLDQRLSFWVSCFNQERIPSRFPYELWGIARFYEGWREGNNLDKAMQLDVLRIFGRKELKLGEDKSRVKEYVESVVKGSRDSIQKLAEELLTAQWIETAHTAAGGECDGII